jgi:hypothetical protein
MMCDLTLLMFIIFHMNSNISTSEKSEVHIITKNAHIVNGGYI